MFLHLYTVLAARYPSNIELTEKNKIVTLIDHLNLHLRAEKLGNSVSLYVSVDSNVSDRVYFKKLYNHSGYQMFVNNNQICYDVFEDKISCDKKTSHIWDVEEYKNGVTICTTVPNKYIDDEESDKNKKHMYTYHKGIFFLHITPNIPESIDNDALSYNYEYCLTLSERQNMYNRFDINVQYARKYYVNQIFSIYEINDIQNIGE